MIPLVYRADFPEDDACDDQTTDMNDEKETSRTEASLRRAELR